MNEPEIYDFKQIKTKMGIDCDGNPRLIIHRPCKDEMERLYPIQAANFMIIQEIIESLPPTAKESEHG